MTGFYRGTKMIWNVIYFFKKEESIVLSNWPRFLHAQRNVATQARIIWVSHVWDVMPWSLLLL